MLEEIAFWCRRITDIFHHENIVPASYYICPQLQYSHGVSIYFPWTLPEGPVTFEPKEDDDERRTSSSQGQPGPKPKSFFVKTPFAEYETYRFGQPEYGDWTRFLKAFFRATLRNVRVVDFEFANDPPKLYRRELFIRKEKMIPIIDLQKSGSETGEADDLSFTIKNYPRRFYISPADCERRMEIPGLPLPGQPDPPPIMDETVRRVSYLGWNIRGILAEEIGLPPIKPRPNENQ